MLALVRLKKLIARPLLDLRNPTSLNGRELNSEFSVKHSVKEFPLYWKVSQNIDFRNIFLREVRGKKIAKTQLKHTQF